MRYLAIVAIGWITLGFLPSAAGPVMTAAKWLGWPLLLLATLREPRRFSVPVGGVVLLAVANQLLFSYQMKGIGLSSWSLFLLAIVLVAPLLFRLYNHPKLSSLSLPFLAGILVMMGLAVLLGYSSVDQFGRAIRAFPFGYKTELAALSLLLLLRVPQEKRLWSTALVIVILVIADSRAGLLAVVLWVAGEYGLHRKWRWLLAVVVPVALVWLASWWGDPSARTRWGLWSAVGNIDLWRVPVESAASLAALQHKEWLAPLLIHGDQLRFPLHLHNDVLSVLLVGWWLIPLAWWKRKTLSALDTTVVLAIFPLLLLDSLLSRPLGLLAVAVAFSSVLYQPDPTGKQAWGTRSGLALQGAMVLIFGWAVLQPFLAPTGCAATFVWFRDGAIACATREAPSSRGYQRVASYYRGTRRWTPDGALVQWLYWRGQGERRKADKLAAITRQRWGLSATWPWHKPVQ